MARIPLIAGNWKMNLDHQQAIALVQKLSWTLRDAAHDYKGCEVVVFPPFTDIRSVQTLMDADKLELGLGAQDLSSLTRVLTPVRFLEHSSRSLMSSTF